MRAFATFIFVVGISPCAFAQTFYCDRPKEPYIPIAYDADYSSMQMTQSDVDSYLRKMKDYVQCLSNEQDDAVVESKRVLGDWNDAVAQFNNR
jgi:hypothetical protein